MIFRKCPNCGNKKLYKVKNQESPDLYLDELKKQEKEMEVKRIAFGPNDKKYYCKDCDFYFN